MTVLRLGDGSLLLHSPIAMTPERRAGVEALGPVAHIYAPNNFHHLGIGEWAKAFPSARLHAPASLARKRPDLRIDRIHHSAPEPAFADVVDEVRIEGFRLDESVLVHRPTRTLVVGDRMRTNTHVEVRPAAVGSGRAYCTCVGTWRWTVMDPSPAKRRSDHGHQRGRLR